MKDPSTLRERYGEGFILELPDGQIVPFRLLSVSDYFKYSRAKAAGIISSEVLEDEIFSKCVLDEVLVENIYKQKAGTPTVVAEAVLGYSAPNSKEEFEYFFNHNRQLVQNALYQLVIYVCMAFPSYTPDDLLSKDIHELFFLLALAEGKLLEGGVLAEPLSFFGAQQQQPEPKKKPKPKVDLSKLSQEYAKQEEEWNVRKLKSQGKKVPKSITKDETPKFDTQNEEGKTIISIQELAHNLNADPTTDSPSEKQMIDDSKWIFGDYIDKLRRGEKIKIKTDEERIADYNKRTEENKKKFKVRKKR